MPNREAARAERQEGSESWWESLFGSGAGGLLPLPDPRRGLDPGQGMPADDFFPSYIDYFLGGYQSGPYNSSRFHRNSDPWSQEGRDARNARDSWRNTFPDDPYVDPPDDPFDDPGGQSFSGPASFSSPALSTAAPDPLSAPNPLPGIGGRDRSLGGMMRRGRRM